MAERDDKPRRRKGAYPLIVAGIIGVGALLVVQSSFSSGTYSLEIAAVQAEPARFEGHDVKVVGTVKEGSSETRTVNGRVETRFTIHDGQGNDLQIVYPHNPPDAFKEGRHVIVEGTFEDDRSVTCGKLTVKCPSKYQEEGGDAGYSDDYYEKKYAPDDADGPTS
ncbi:MAG: cytochrome c maturation protein CcmE [Myxococcota bacterium]